LEDANRQYAAFLTHVALEPLEGHNTHDFQSAIAKLPQEGLEEVVHTLLQAMEGTSGQQKEYWANRIQPFLLQVLPQTQSIISKQIVFSLVFLCIAANSEFPAAIESIKNWLQPIENPDIVLMKLSKSNLCERFPKNSLQLLDAIIVDQPIFTPELTKCLKAIVGASPHLQNDYRYQKLVLYAREKGIF
jgi:hypothetical protein